MVSTAVSQAEGRTNHHQEFEIRPGQPRPLGATVTPEGVNFAVRSQNGIFCTLVLFELGASEPMAEIAFPMHYRHADTYALLIPDLDWRSVEYGYRFLGPFNPAEGHRFDPSRIMLDPYAKEVSGREVWGQEPDRNAAYAHRGRIVQDDFDWGGDQPLQLPIEDTVIYEMHARGFTRHPSSGVQHPGTFRGMMEKIPYLKELGVNCVELMPIFEFDEFEGRLETPDGEVLLNYWGYSTLNYFSPKAGYAASGKDRGAARELKELVKALHQNGIEVILDVVYNHTAEGNQYGPSISFKGIDNKTYYLLTPEGYYYNFSGTGNTVNCNHPLVVEFILDSLRYWAKEFHVDGFRFDLASILTRGGNGGPIPDPPVVRAIAEDEELAHCKLIAEPWDAGGLYHVGTFPLYGRWSEWNGKYRDTMRRFLKGDLEQVGEVSQRLQGSPDMYEDRGPIASINFITAHDGFTLLDLMSYNGKHNEANGEDNRDGLNDNYSFNYGVEGETGDPGINAIRRRQVKNALVLLMVSQGVPMIMMGDEMGRTLNGNNNPWRQDNESNWLDWTLKEENAEIFRFFKTMIAFRMTHPVLRNGYHYRNEDYQEAGYADISWHGIEAWDADWSDDSRIVAFLLSGKHAKGGLATDNFLYVAFNMNDADFMLELPALPEGLKWYVAVNTGIGEPEDIWDIGQEHELSDQEFFYADSRSAIVLIGK